MPMNPHALHICLKLRAEGYKAYFAGGWVRDWLLGHPSFDVDIATDAPLTKVLDLFPDTILVGLAFGVVIVQIEGSNFEVAAFRRDISYTDGRKPDAIEPSTPQEDAKRRDFTLNGLFYDPIDEKLYDYVGGEEDLRKGIIRAIGDPFERFIEDRLRMVRAIRFSARFGFPIDLKTEEAIVQSAPTLFPAVAKERIYQELSKMSDGPNFEKALIDLCRLGLLGEIFPSLKHLHLNDLKRMAHALPAHLPLVAKLRVLFHGLTPEVEMEEFLSLKISAKEKGLIEFLQKGEQDLKNKRLSTPSAWAYFYANPASKIAIELYSDKKEHEERKRELSPHIARLQNKKPLITSKELMEKGIKPGIEMGLLLKKAEILGIDHNFHTAEEILKKMNL